MTPFNQHFQKVTNLALLRVDQGKLPSTSFQLQNSMEQVKVKESWKPVQWIKIQVLITFIKQAKKNRFLGSNKVH